MNSEYNSWVYWIALILPSLIAGIISIVSIITNYRSSKMNNFRNMVFTQKEKVVDQFIEKSSELIAISDPLVLNAKINEFTPTIISHREFMSIMQELMSIDNRVQTLSSIIKLHTWSIYEKNTIKEIGDMFSAVDEVQKLIQEMILKLIKLHSSNTKEGEFLRIDPMKIKDDLEKEFSEKYREPYIVMVVSITNVAKVLRIEAVNLNGNKKQKKNRNK
ncbi:MAG: hypothetical protein IJN14_03415 [Ruminococcus sp.]|nr:hypothetical protein [Ruminococcus sp.]